MSLDKLKKINKKAKKKKKIKTDTGLLFSSLRLDFSCRLSLQKLFWISFLLCCANI